jgi:hypothetical protein
MEFFTRFSKSGTEELGKYEFSKEQMLKRSPRFDAMT